MPRHRSAGSPDARSRLRIGNPRYSRLEVCATPAGWRNSRNIRARARRPENQPPVIPCGHKPVGVCGPSLAADKSFLLLIRLSSELCTPVKSNVLACPAMGRIPLSLSESRGAGLREFPTQAQAKPCTETAIFPIVDGSAGLKLGGKGRPMNGGQIGVSKKAHINKEENIMLTNSTNSDRPSNAARSAVAASAGHRLRIGKTLLWLALPFALAAGCASGPDRNVAGDYPAPAIDRFPTPLQQPAYTPSAPAPDYTREYVREPVGP